MKKNYTFKHSAGCSLFALLLSGACFSPMAMAQTSVADVAVPVVLSETNPTASELATWQSALDEIFADKACTQLNATYVAYTQEQMEADANYQALPTVLKNMVLKMIAGGTWDEPNVDESKPQWDAEYAQRFRVQLIEPYSNKESAAQALGMQAHTHLNNPTGIYGNAGDALYIMVEGEVKDGSALYIATWTGHGKPSNDYTAGLQLKPGLNVLPIGADGTIGCINYTVHTLNQANGKGTSALQYKLSDYDDIKVHIEGGYINGYYNAVGDALWGEGDTPADWDYIAARATHDGVTILGKYMTLQFPFFDTVTEGNHGTDYYFTGKNNIDKVLQEWDNVMLWERMLMGVAPKDATLEANKTWTSPYSDKDEVIAYTGDESGTYACDYSDYYNVHGLAFGVGGSAYMYGSWDHSGYHYNTMPSIMNDIVGSAGSHWGPAHEIGHQHQQPLTLNGLTEVTNNLFSNVVYWYYGKSTSRVNGDEGSLENVAKAFNTPGGDFYTNNIWGLTHMYYRLFMYYHVLGHNTSFYPRLYEMLRHDPMRRSYMQEGPGGLLHFYKKACLAAEEDLTEFFRAHGLLTPMKDRFVGDYSNSIYNCTQEEIDEAIAFVKSKGFKVNLAPIYINDGTGEEIIGSTGETLELYDGRTTANVGSYAYFYTPAEAHTYTYKNDKIVMSGTGGVGYAVLDENNTIVGFANKRSFPIKDETAALLVAGKAKVYVVNGDNTLVEATTDAEVMQRAMLLSLVEKAESMVEIADETGMKVGFYKSEMMGDVTAAATAAREAYDAKEAAKYAEVYEALFEAITSLEANADAVVKILPNSTYMLENYRAEGYVMGINATTKKLIGARKNTKSSLQQWIFEPADEEDCYYLKNKQTKTYIDLLVRDTQGTAKSTEPTVAYKVISLGDGLLAVQCQGEKEQSLNYNSSVGVLGWDYVGDEGSYWYITATELDETELNKLTLKEVIANTTTLLEEMGDSVLLPGAIPLQCTDANAPFYISSNADQNEVGASSDGGGVKALLDGETTTYFHSQWSGTAVSENHYLQIDLGEDYDVTSFSITYATRNAGDAGATSPAPSAFQVKGGKKPTLYTRTFATYPSAEPKNPLPLYTEQGKYWTSKVFTTTTAYRYLRLIVTASQGPGNTTHGGKAFFAMSEFKLNNTKAIVKSLKEEYVGADSIYEDVANYTYEATQVLENTESTEEEIATALAEMQEKYAALVAASQGDLGIHGMPTTESTKRRGIYDLSGRRLLRIEQPGIYIIDGEKRMMK